MRLEEESAAALANADKNITAVMQQLSLYKDVTSTQWVSVQSTTCQGWDALVAAVLVSQSRSLPWLLDVELVGLTSFNGRNSSSSDSQRRRSNDKMQVRNCALSTHTHPGALFS